MDVPESWTLSSIIHRFIFIFSLFVLLFHLQAGYLSQAAAAAGYTAAANAAARAYGAAAAQPAVAYAPIPAK